jgi:pimeloyl-ACP methyl ester carboxylesterase
LLLLHGVTSNAGAWWRVGPALAAAGSANGNGRRVVAVDLPGHGPSANWSGRHRCSDTADDLAVYIRAAGLDLPELAVVGHSWGAMVTAHLPGAGILPGVIVLLDPPYLTVEQLEALTREPDGRPYDSVDDARAAVRLANPGWAVGDVEAKARALTEFDAEAVHAVLVHNGDYDAALAALARSETRVPAWLIAGQWASGGFIPDSAIPMMRRQLGAERVIVIPGAPHSPQRTHPEATVAAILHALGRS